MITHPLSKRYARALFELADEKNILAQVIDDLKSFASILESEKQLRSFLSSTKVEQSKKVQVVTDLLKGKTSEVLVNFVKILIQKGRLQYLSDIVFNMTVLSDAKNNRKQAKVTTVVELSDSQLKTIQDILAKTFDAEIVLNNKVDASIMGGVIIQVDGKVLDSSLSHQLNELKNQMKSAKTMAA